VRLSGERVRLREKENEEVGRSGEGEEVIMRKRQINQRGSDTRAREKSGQRFDESGFGGSRDL
jgi:hypothetical protein